MLIAQPTGLSFASSATRNPFSKLPQGPRFQRYNNPNVSVGYLKPPATDPLAYTPERLIALSYTEKLDLLASLMPGGKQALASILSGKTSLASIPSAKAGEGDRVRSREKVMQINPRLFNTKGHSGSLLDVLLYAATQPTSDTLLLPPMYTNWGALYEGNSFAISDEFLDEGFKTNTPYKTPADQLRLFIGLAHAVLDKAVMMDLTPHEAFGFNSYHPELFQYVKYDAASNRILSHDAQDEAKEIITTYVKETILKAGTQEIKAGGKTYTMDPTSLTSEALFSLPEEARQTLLFGFDLNNVETPVNAQQWQRAYTHQLNGIRGALSAHGIFPGALMDRPPYGKLLPTGLGQAAGIEYLSYTGPDGRRVFGSLLPLKFYGINAETGALNYQQKNSKAWDYLLKKASNLVDMGVDGVRLDVGHINPFPETAGNDFENPFKSMFKALQQKDPKLTVLLEMFGFGSFHDRSRAVGDWENALKIPEGLAASYQGNLYHDLGQEPVALASALIDPIYSSHQPDAARVKTTITTMTADYDNADKTPQAFQARSAQYKQSYFQMREFLRMFLPNVGYTVAGFELKDKNTRDLAEPARFTHTFLNQKESHYRWGDNHERFESAQRLNEVFATIWPRIVNQPVTMMRWEPKNGDAKMLIWKFSDASGKDYLFVANANYKEVVRADIIVQDYPIDLKKSRVLYQSDSHSKARLDNMSRSFEGAADGNIVFQNIGPGETFIIELDPTRADSPFVQPSEHPLGAKREALFVSA
jgi:hypothetical protein